MKNRYVARVYLVPDVEEKADGSEMTIQQQTDSQFNEETDLLFTVQGDRKEEICQQIMRIADTGPGNTDQGPGNSDVGNNT